MPLEARASKTVRNKNALIILMCVGCMAWFGYDGWVRWPAQNDAVVHGPLVAMLKDGRISEEHRTAIESWPGWNESDKPTQDHMTDITQTASKVGTIEGWKTRTDIVTQKYIVGGLFIAVLSSIWWFLHCQNRRAIADDQTLSPAPGLVIPWHRITIVDNNRWKSTGIVDITFVNEKGQPQKTKLDDYELEREPLLSILDQLAEKATGAEFLPKEEAAPAETPATT